VAAQGNPRLLQRLDFLRNAAVQALS
jgi:hypothetical protein